jgi:ribosomal protein S18 acetylase RimI-like enzyme
VIVRGAVAVDTPRVAELHAARITEGFLTQLGPRFLQLLYRRVVRSPHAFLLVAVDHDEVAGFLAGASDLRRLYRSFVARDGVTAAVTTGPRLLRSLPQVLETSRYPSETGELPTAEILSMAVDAEYTRRGVGRALVEAGTTEFRRRGVDAAKVVIAEANGSSLRLYEDAGFARRRQIAVHRGTVSEVLVWNSSSQ